MDVAAACRAGESLAGEHPLAEFERLAGSVQATADGADRVRWQVQAEERPVAGGAPEWWLTLHAEVQVRLPCQRCLLDMPWPLAAERRLRFVRGEAEAARLDEELEDDVLELHPRHDLLELIEDELILALPLVPRHDICPVPVPMSAGEDEVQPDPVRDHPFAALARLKKDS
jgi:uncharacterized protein